MHLCFYYCCFTSNLCFMAKVLFVIEYAAILSLCFLLKAFKHWVEYSPYCLKVSSAVCLAFATDLCHHILSIFVLFITHLQRWCFFSVPSLQDPGCWIRTRFYKSIGQSVLLFQIFLDLTLKAKNFNTNAVCLGDQVS